MRMWESEGFKTAVLIYCSSSTICSAIEEACDDDDDDLNVKVGKCLVGCCDSDYCNAGSSFSFGVILMTVTSALGLALLK